MHIRSVSFVAAAVLVAANLSAQIYDNGPIVTNPTGAGGSPLSELQNLAPLALTVFGFGAQVAAGNSLADDFAICGTALVTDIEVFGYLTGGTVPAATAVQLEVYNGDPSAGGVPVAGSPGWGVNLIGAPGYTVANTLTGIFRSLLPVGTTRNVQSIKVTLPAPLVLTQGVYWLRFGYTGVNFTPPITVLNQGLTGNALQNTTATGWLPVTSGTTPVYAQGLPFKLYGAPITAGSITNTGLAACGATTITVNGAPVLGGFVRTELGGVTGLGLIGYGFSPVPTPFCGCVVGHDWSVVILANSTVLNIPMATAFCGTRLRVQGADFGGVGGCALGITFTDTYQIALN